MSNETTRTQATPAIDPQLIGAFNPLFLHFSSAPILQKERPLLAHYTSISAMERILQNSEIWFSNPLFMNDLQEMRFGLGAILRPGTFDNGRQN